MLSNNTIRNRIDEEIDYDYSKIPEFISGDDKPVYDAICSTLILVKKLNIDRFMSEKEIECKALQAQHWLNKIIEFSSVEMRVAAFIYLNFLFEKYIKIAENDEIYEFISNLNKWKNEI